GSTQRPDLVEAEKSGGCGDQAGASRRGRDDDSLDTGDERRDGAHHEGGHETSRDVDADRAEGHPASLELHPRPYLGTHLPRPLTPVPPSPRIREREQRARRQPRRRLGPARLAAVEPERPFAHRLVAAAADVLQDRGDARHVRAASARRGRAGWTSRPRPRASAGASPPPPPEPTHPP